MVSSKYSDAQYADNYADGMENHFWTVARNRLIHRTLSNRLADAGRVLEIGCGRGLVLQYLRAQGLDCWGCEPGAPNVLASIRPYVFLEKEFSDLDAQFRQGIDVLLLLDVLEHIEDDVGFLQKMKAGFLSARAVVLTVPARSELWSNYDEYYGHYRRYDRATLTAALDQGGFRVVGQRYFFHELYVPMLMAKLLAGRRKTKPNPPTNYTRMFHRLIAATSGLCSSLFPSSLPGTSLIAVVVPKEN